MNASTIRESNGEHERWQLLLIALAWLVAAAAVLGVTARGVGLSPDSLQYLAAGESLVAGRGLITVAWDGEPVPLTHFPPGYPLLIAAALQAGFDADQFLRAANVLLFGLTIVLGVLFVRRLAPGSPWAAPAAAFAIAVSHDLVVTHSMAWSEPLYVTLTLAALLALAVAIRSVSLPLLGLAALLSGATVAVRYVGVANVAVTGLAVLFWWRATTPRRWLTAIGSGVIALVPVLVVMAAAAQAGDGTVANRRLVWHPIGFTHLREAVSVAVKWVTPYSDANLLTAVWLLLVVLTCGLVWHFSRRSPAANPTPVEARLLVLFAVTYFVVLALSISVADAQTSFIARLMLPVYVPVLLVGVAWLAWRGARDGRAALAAAVVLMLVFGASVLRVLPWLHEGHRHGVALLRVDRDAAPLLSIARQLPPAALLLSNDPYFVRLHTGRDVAGLPRRRDPNSLLPNGRHPQQVRGICDSAAARPTFIMLFDDPMSSDSSADAAAAIDSGEMQLLPGGAVIRVRPGCRA